MIQRKLDDNLATLGTSILGLMLLVAAVLFVGLWFWKRDRLRAVLTVNSGVVGRVRRKLHRARRPRLQGSTTPASPFRASCWSCSSPCGLDFWC